MRKVTMTIPELVLISATRGLLGAGLALILGDRLRSRQRRSVGWTMALIGALSTIPLGLEVFGPKAEERLEKRKAA